MPIMNETTGVNEMWDTVKKQRLFTAEQQKSRKLIGSIVKGESSDEVADMLVALKGIYLNEISYEFPLQSVTLRDIAAQAVKQVISERIGKKLDRMDLIEVQKFLHDIFMQLEVMPSPKDTSRTNLQLVFLQAVHDGGIVEFMKDNLDKRGKEEKKKDAEGPPQMKDIFYRIVSMAIDRAKSLKSKAKDELTPAEAATSDLQRQLVNDMDELPKAFAKKIETSF